MEKQRTEKNRKPNITDPVDSIIMQVNIARREDTRNKLLRFFRRKGGGYQ